MMRDKGLTLVELLVALAISGILLAAALRVATNLSRESRRNAAAEAAAAPEGLREILAVDILHARRYRHDKAGLTLLTQASLDADDLTLEHVQCEVAYEVRTEKGASRLFRIERRGTDGLFTELAADGITAVRLRAGPKPPEPVGVWKAMPAIAAVEMDRSLAGSEPVRMEFLTRWRP